VVQAPAPGESLGERERGRIGMDVLIAHSSVLEAVLLPE